LSRFVIVRTFLFGGENIHQNPYFCGVLPAEP
jgi:hypothetical protein